MNGGVFQSFFYVVFQMLNLFTANYICCNYWVRLFAVGLQIHFKEYQIKEAETGETYWDFIKQEMHIKFGRRNFKEKYYLEDQEVDGRC